MVVIKQDTKLERQKLESLLKVYGKATYTFDLDALEDDIKKVEIAEKEAHTAYRLENAKKTKAYLEGIRARAKKGQINVEWFLNNHKVSSMPIEFKKITQYNIQTTDYIQKTSDSVVVMDYSELTDVIALELTHNEFELSEHMADESMQDIGLLASYPASRLLNLVGEKAIFEKSRGLRISSSRYSSPERKYNLTYFMSKLKYDPTYRRIVEDSADNSISIILYNILTKAAANKYNVKIMGVFSDSIALAIPKEKSKEIEDELAVGVIIRSFGRKFEVYPKVRVF